MCAGNNRQTKKNKGIAKIWREEQLSYTSKDHIKTGNEGNKIWDHPITTKSRRGFEKRLLKSKRRIRKSVRN